jgi:hypothetical protein
MGILTLILRHLIRFLVLVQLGIVILPPGDGTSRSTSTIVSATEGFDRGSQQQQCFADRQEYIDKLLTRGRWVELPPSVPNTLAYRTQRNLAVREGFSAGTCANSSQLIGQRYTWQSRTVMKTDAMLSVPMPGDDGRGAGQRSRQDLCRTINGRNILIVGDSISNGELVSLVTTLIRV